MLDHRVHDELPVLLQQRIRLVIRKVSVRFPVGGDYLDVQGFQDWSHHWPGHAVSAVNDNLEAVDGFDINERRDLLCEVRSDQNRLHSTSAWRWAKSCRNKILDLADAAIA